MVGWHQNTETENYELHEDVDVVCPCMCGLCNAISHDISHTVKWMPSTHSSPGLTMTQPSTAPLSPGVQSSFLSNGGTVGVSTAHIHHILPWQSCYQCRLIDWPTEHHPSGILKLSLRVTYLVSPRPNWPDSPSPQEYTSLFHASARKWLPSQWCASCCISTSPGNVTGCEEHKELQTSLLHMGEGYNAGHHVLR